MSARPSVVFSDAGQRAALLSTFTPGNVEALKWCGVVAMLIEHAHTLVFHEHGGWSFQIGRVAFPLFAFAFALALDRNTCLKAYRAAYRLAGWAFVAQIGSVVARGSGTLNVLFIFVSAAAWVAAADERVMTRWLVRVLCCAVSFFSEFWLPGLAVVVGMVHAARVGGSRSGVVAAWLGLVLIGLQDNTFSAFAFVAVVAVVGLLDISVKRLPSFFAAVYVGQFPFFVALRSLL